MSVYSVYLVRCNDGSVYTGISTSVERRLSEHASSSRGAKYLRGKGPLTLLYQREVGSRSAATRVEMKIKALPKSEKLSPEKLAGRVADFVADCQQ